MATRGTIAIEFGDGTVQQIYCHYDNYISGTGTTLTNHYMDPEKVLELMHLGDISSLRETIGETKDQAYAHWNGEKLNIRQYDDIDYYKLNVQREEYNYIMRVVDGTPKWFLLSENSDNNTLSELSIDDTESND